MNSYENPQLSHECDLTAERDKLREINKVLLEALQEAERAFEGRYPWHIYGSFTQKEAREAALGTVRNAIARAKGEA